MEYNLRELLDKIYELEGLIHLALKRDDISDDILRLISSKGEEIGTQCRNLKNNEIPEVPKDLEIESIQTSPAFPSAFSLDEYSIDEESDADDSRETEVPDYNLNKIEEPRQKEEDAIRTDFENRRGKLVFSINDRFRFKKELFNNSDIDFNNTLALVASMENYEEAEDYFLNDEGFERADEIVREFLDIIKKYFK